MYTKYQIYITCQAPNLRVWNEKLFFLFFNQDIRFGYSKEPSQWDFIQNYIQTLFKTIKDVLFQVKLDVYKVSDIPVRHQI